MDGLHANGTRKELKPMRKEFDDADIAAFEPSEKVGLVATLTGAGEPHVTLLTTICANGAKGLTIGEFSRGLSKENMASRGKVGFLVMSLDRRLWRGKAIWKRSAKDGPEYVKYNRQPMFCYNTYFGINTVHYLDLVDIEGPAPLPLAGVALASVATALKARAARPRSSEPVLPPFAVSILDALASLNFLAFVDADGFPRIVPVLQARSAGTSRIVFTPGPWGAELAAMPQGAAAAVFSMNLGMEGFFARGQFLGCVKRGLLGVDLDYLYNAMPSLHGQVWPARPLEARTEF